MLQGARILIVDDERTTRLSLSEIFSLRGANTSTAADGNEALAQIQQTTYDLIILDVKMPGISGLQVLEYVQQHAPGTGGPDDRSHQPGLHEQPRGDGRRLDRS